MAAILFNTANLVGRVTGYRFTLSDWGAQESQTIAATDEKEFAAICHDIQAAGYDAVELWIAHCHPSVVTPVAAKTRRIIAADHGIRIEALAGAYTRDNLAIAEALGARCINGGLWGTDLASIQQLVAGSGVAYNYENHPETTPEEMIAAIDGGSEHIGVALDTGWIGTAGSVDAPTFVRTLGPLLRHVHLKDVAARGGHQTVKLGAGCVGIEALIRQMKSQGYAGMWSWEDEPENRNPLLIAGEMREWIASRVS